MTYPDFDESPEDQEPVFEAPVTAPAPPLTAPWTWSANTLLWIGGGVLALSVGVWFLMSYSKAKAAALAALEGSNDGAE